MPTAPTPTRAPGRLRRLAHTARTSAPLLIGYATFVAVMGTLTAHVEHWAVADGIWWAQTTTTTVGYGDLAPHTLLGRFVLGLITMLGGIYTVALIIANVVETRDAWTHEEQEEMFALLRAHRAELGELRGELRALATRLPPPAAAEPVTAEPTTAEPAAVGPSAPGPDAAPLPA